jgi:hypothetical protein
VSSDFKAKKNIRWICPFYQKSKGFADIPQGFSKDVYIGKVNVL